MLVLNFSHPITDAQRLELETITGQPINRLVDAMPHFVHDAPFAPQIRALVDQISLTAVEWQTLPILVNLPGYAPGAAALLAELHGRMGYFPAVIRLQPVAGSTPTTYAVGEIINLQTLRDEARRLRSA
jgi:transposase